MRRGSNKAVHSGGFSFGKVMIKTLNRIRDNGRLAPESEPDAGSNPAFPIFFDRDVDKRILYGIIEL